MVINPSSGGMAEWLKAAVLKTVVRKYRGFESYFLRHIFWRDDRAGRWCSPAKRVWGSYSTEGSNPSLSAICFFVPVGFSNRPFFSPNLLLPFPALSQWSTVLFFLPPNPFRLCPSTTSTFERSPQYRKLLFCDVLLAVCFEKVNFVHF